MDFTSAVTATRPRRDAPRPRARFGPPAPAARPSPTSGSAGSAPLPLEYQPGERWLYNTGADVLGVLIARGPSGRRSTRSSATASSSRSACATPASPCRRRRSIGSARATAPDRRPVARRSPMGSGAQPPAFPGGGGGLVSTAADYLAFAGDARSHGGGGLSGPAHRTAMTTDQLTRRGAPRLRSRIRRGRRVGASAWACRSPHSAAYRSVGTYGWDGGLGSIVGQRPGRGPRRCAADQPGVEPRPSRRRCATTSGPRPTPPPRTDPRSGCRRGTG